MHGVYMKASEFLGKRVLDKDALEIGKVSDMEIDPLKGVINTVIISKSELALRQQTFIVTIEQLDKLGDYLIIKETGASLEYNPEEDMDDVGASSISIEKID